MGCRVENLRGYRLLPYFPGPREKPVVHRGDVRLREDLCTTEARRHGEKHKIDGLVPDRRGFALSKPGFRYLEAVYTYQRAELREMPVNIGKSKFPCTRFSDGEVKLKYRNPGFRQSENPAARHEPIYLCGFLRDPAASWCAFAFKKFDMSNFTPGRPSVFLKAALCPRR